MSADTNCGAPPLRAARDLPHSLEAEQAVLGAILSDEAALGEVAALLTPGDFYRLEHQHIYEACIELARDAKTIDAVMVQQALDAKGLLGGAVPQELPYSLQRAVGTTANVVHYARVVIEVAGKRRFMLAMQAAVENGYASPAGYISDSLSALQAAASEGDRGSAPAVLTLDDVKNPPRERFALGHLLPFQKVSLLYGPTSIGKSAAAAQVVFAFAAGKDSLWGLPIYRDEETGEIGGPVVVYTCEDTLDDWKRKAAAVHTAGGIDVERALGRIWIIDRTEGIARLSEIVTMRENRGTGETISRRISRPTPERDRLVAAVRKLGARFLLVETASRLVEEEDNPSFSILQSDLGCIARETGVAALLSHHPTKASSKENDSAIESVRGGGALVGNARNVLALYPTDDSDAKPYRERFPRADLVTLAHRKPTSSTRLVAPMVLVRTDGTWGAVFRLPDEVKLTPEQEEKNADHIEQERQRELDGFRRLYEVVERYLPTRPAMSPSWLRDHHHAEIGVPKNGARGVEALVGRAVALGFLRERTRTKVGITLALGVDPRKPIAASVKAPEEQADAEAPAAP